jgi:hypothetical protein
MPDREHRDALQWRLRGGIDDQRFPRPGRLRRIPCEQREQHDREEYLHRRHSTNGPPDCPYNAADRPAVKEVA